MNVTVGCLGSVCPSLFRQGRRLGLFGAGSSPQRTGGGLPRLTRPCVLLVDADVRSLGLLRPALERSGYSVCSAGTAAEALTEVRRSAPALILSETRLPDLDGFELGLRLRADESLSNVPLVYLSSAASVGDKIRGLELGAADYLTKPIYVKEVLVRVRGLLRGHAGGSHLAASAQAAERGHDPPASPDPGHEGKPSMSGELGGMPLGDLLQTLELGRKSAVMELVRDGAAGRVFLRAGRVVDAEVGAHAGATAVYQLLTWTDGRFTIAVTEHDRVARIECSTQALLLEGLRRIDEGNGGSVEPGRDRSFAVAESAWSAAMTEAEPSGTPNEAEWPLDCPAHEAIPPRVEVELSPQRTLEPAPREHQEVGDGRRKEAPRVPPRRGRFRHQAAVALASVALAVTVAIAARHHQASLAARDARAFLAAARLPPPPEAIQVTPLPIETSPGPPVHGTSSRPTTRRSTSRVGAGATALPSLTQVAIPGHELGPPYRKRTCVRPCAWRDG